MTNSDLGDHDWWEHYQEVVNNDDEMEVRGHDKFNENFYVEIGDERFLIQVEHGKVDDVIPEPGMNNQWSFGVEGSRKAWKEFVQEVPPAFNHEIIASHYRSAVKEEEDHLQLTGSNKKIFQNLRAFQRALDLMRKTHNNGGEL
ncbi:hypothetical protein [Halogranum rubrum]|uniref:SCP2 domain-containing protein n=1 Tax=Halogranum salarium B-1 TaxID=1210908 RepID=J2ZA11_9EURY|nr:hypothetical protein [Halogranum salarium]EJN57490.1 hypothetical protein HSB1_41780 [Halogranum salarium B-1]